MLLLAAATYCCCVLFVQARARGGDAQQRDGCHVRLVCERINPIATCPVDPLCLTMLPSREGNIVSMLGVSMLICNSRPVLQKRLKWTSQRATAVMLHAPLEGHMQPVVYEVRLRPIFTLNGGTLNLLLISPLCDNLHVAAYSVVPCVPFVVGLLSWPLLS